MVAEDEPITIKIETVMPTAAQTLEENTTESLDKWERKSCRRPNKVMDSSLACPHCHTTRKATPTKKLALVANGGRDQLRFWQRQSTVSAIRLRSMGSQASCRVRSMANVTALVATLLFASAAMPVGAEVYKCTMNGHVLYADQQCDTTAEKPDLPLANVVTEIDQREQANPRKTIDATINARIKAQETEREAARRLAASYPTREVEAAPADYVYPYAYYAALHQHAHRFVHKFQRHREKLSKGLKRR